MTTRDPRSRDSYRPAAPGGAREPTQPLSLLADDDSIEYVPPPGGAVEEPAHPSLALGTHGAPADAPAKSPAKSPAHGLPRPPGTDRTGIASPAARVRPQRSQPPPIPRAPDDEPDRVGTVLGSYKILELLGKGGMGYVFRAEHTKLGREVALKLLRRDYASRRDAVARFFQEARTVNRVRHRNIVDVTDFVELPDGTTFIIMELLSGQSLGKWARTGIDLPRALAVLVQICDGLGAAHEVGVIHRDLKPDNIIVVPTPDGGELVKLLDFGVAKLVNRDDEDVGFQTAAGSVIGTPAYMSPEQAGGMPVDARSDIYSLGAIMYELFCGQPLFRGRSFGEYVRKHLTELPVPPRATPNGGQIDPRLEALILRCLEKDPIGRFAKIGELRDAMLAMLGGMELAAPGLAGLTGLPVAGGGFRAMASVSLTPIPQLPMLMQHGSSPGLSSGAAPMLPGPGSSGAHLFYSQSGHVIPSTGVRPQRTPWWVWFVGGALAVGVGVAAATWYAGRGDLPVVPAPTPAPVPAAAPPPVAVAPAGEPPPASPATVEPAAHLEVKLDSLPSGSVFADGHAAELCRTPCTLDIDPRDGGPSDRRTFLVRSDGYRDGTIVVDLTGAQRAFQVTLERAAVAGPPEEDPARKPQPGRLRPPRPGITRPATKPGDATTKPGDAATKPGDATTKPGDATAKPDDTEPTDPGPTSTPRKKPRGPIDPTDTLDPFRRRSSP